MHKKNILLMLPVLLLSPLVSLSALPEFTMSGGGGLLLGGLFTNYTITANDADVAKVGTNKLKMTQEAQQFNIGGFAFFDATYGEFALTIQHGTNSYQEKENANVRKGTGSETMLGFTLLGKYPFKLKDGLFLYPLGGIEYQIALVEKRTDDILGEHHRTDGATEFPGANLTLSAWNSLMIKIGGGLDFSIKDPWYIKSEFLYSFRLMTKYEKESVAFLKRDYGISEPKLFANPGMKGLTHGPELRLAVGYRFK